MHRFTSSLQYSDEAWWSQEFGYSRDIAGVLDRAYRLIRLGDQRIEGFPQAASVAETHLTSRMSRRQRLHLYFVLAKANAGVGWYEDAVCWLDRARDEAQRLRDLDMQLELLALRASYNRARLRLKDAIEDRTTCLDILDIQAAEHGTSNPAAQLDTLAQLATYAFFLGQYKLAEGAIERSRALALLVPKGQFDMASTEWVQAHLYRTYGEPRRALHHALGFYDDYSREASMISRDRLEFFLACVAFEWAERLPQSAEREIYQALGLKHLERAEDLANQSNDIPGLGLIKLARVHYSRLVGSDLDRVRTLEEALWLGQHINDVALQAQAYTALGDEYQAQGDLVSAHGCYKQTRVVLQGSHVPVLAIPARRALLRMEEMNV